VRRAALAAPFKYARGGLVVVRVALVGVVVLAAVALGGCSGSGGGGGNDTASTSESFSFPPVTNNPKSSPYVTINYAPKSPAPGDEVAFGVAFTRPNRVAQSYAWDFGDKDNSSEPSPTHAFAAETAGTGPCKDKGYQVSVDILDDANATTMGFVCVLVKIKPPVVSYTFAPAAPAPGDQVQFSASAQDPDGTVTSYTWDFGDGSTATTPLASHSFEAPSPGVTPACKGAGGYNVTLTVRDDDGGSTASKQCIVVKVRAPVVSFTVDPAAPAVGDTVRFNGTATDSDGTIKSILWDFGDGGTSTVLSPTHKFTGQGADTTSPCSAKTKGFVVTLSATDDDGGVGTAKQCVVVSA
jgi:PKD repeat protein